MVESGELTSERRASFLKLKSNFLGEKKACNIYRGTEHVSSSGSPSMLGALSWAWPSRRPDRILDGAPLRCFLASSPLLLVAFLSLRLLQTTLAKMHGSTYANPFFYIYHLDSKAVKTSCPGSGSLSDRPQTPGAGAQACALANSLPEPGRDGHCSTK